MYTHSDVEKMIKQSLRKSVWELDRITWVEKQKARVYLLMRNSAGGVGMRMNFSLAFRERLFEYQDDDDKLGNLTVFVTSLSQMGELLTRLLP